VHRSTSRKYKIGGAAAQNRFDGRSLEVQIRTIACSLASSFDYISDCSMALPTKWSQLPRIAMIDLCGFLSPASIALLATVGVACCVQLL
jgi:hypothetical protein